MKKLIENNGNYQLVLSLIIKSEGISRAQIARETTLNRSTISYITKNFLDSKLIIEDSEKILTGGRSSKLLRFNYNIEQLLIVDLQKNKVKFLITNLEGKIINSSFFYIDHDDENSLDQIHNELHTTLLEFQNITHCGLAIHGVVSNNKKIIESPFYNYNYNEIYALISSLNLIPFIENEANVYTNGIRINYESDCTSLINIHIKDGIGCGQILGNKLQRGQNGFAGEIGHSIAVMNGKQCACGNKGCLELYCSEQSLVTAIKDCIDYKQLGLTINDAVKNNITAYHAFNFALDLLSVMINDLVLFSDIQNIYITSDIYSSFDNIQDEIEKRLTSTNYIKPTIKVISADICLLSSGFSNIILSEVYKIS